MWVFVLAGLLATGIQCAAHTSDGQITAGTLLELAADRVVLQTSEGKKTLPTQSVTGIMARTSTTPVKSIDKPQAWIELVDGSIIRGSNYRVAKGKVRFDLAG